MDEIERFWAVQGIEADLLHRRERLAAEREAARRAAYARRAARAAQRQAEPARSVRGRWARLRRWAVPGSGAWRVAR